MLHTPIKIGEAYTWASRPDVYLRVTHSEDWGDTCYKIYDRDTNLLKDFGRSATEYFYRYATLLPDK